MGPPDPYRVVMTVAKSRDRKLSKYANDVLVEPSWLERHLSDDSIRIVEVDEHPDRYREAHIPGAIGLDWRLDLQDPVKRASSIPRLSAGYSAGAVSRTTTS